MYPSSKLPKKSGMQKLIDASPARRMLREMDDDSQDTARQQGVSTDEISRKRRAEKMKGR